jgi:hypothetical protein
MIHNLALTIILGMPAVAYGGLITLILMLSTAAIAILNHKGVQTIPLKWHPRLALVTIIFALIHAIFGLSIFLNF